VRQKDYTVSSNGESGGGRNRTIFRPSPLSGLKPPQPQAPPEQAAPPPAAAWGAPESVVPSAPPQPQQYPPPEPAQFAPAPQLQPQYQTAPAPRLDDDDIPVPATPRTVRNLLNDEACTVLALASSVRSGRARISMPEFHRQASEAISRYEQAISAGYPEETRQRAKYVLCATIDDIAQNLPSIGHDGAEWARRSLVVQFFRENIGGDRFWQLVDDLLARPGQNAELIELFHSCLAAGFEGRFRVMPDGKRRLHEIMSKLYGALEHPRSLSMQEISPRWKGLAAPLKKVGLWSHVALAAAAAGLLMLIIYAVLRLVLMSTGEDSWAAVRGLTPETPLRLSRLGAPPPAAADSQQVSRLRTFLEPEIRQKLVTVEEDASTVRVRTTVGQLFQSGSDRLETGRQQLFERIGRAVEAEKGSVTIEGHADSDKVSSLAFPDNLALSKARAETVAGIIRDMLSNPGRISAKGFGDSQPIASNDTADGKSKNRRVEIVVPRQQ
jgi:type VI secretion system peptidoglycan-associated protein